MDPGKNRFSFRLRYLAFSTALLILASPSFAGKIKKTEEQKREISIEKQTTIHVENSRGTTRIIGGRKTRTVMIKAVKIIKASSDEEARKILNGLTIEVKKTNDKISIITHYPKETIREKRGFMNFFYKLRRKAIMNYYIEVPACMNAEVKSKSGDTYVTGIDGSVAVACASGDVYLERIGGTAEIDLSSGDIHAENIKGDLKATSASGDSYVDYVGGDFYLESASGDARVSNIGGRVRVSLVSGDFFLKKCKGDVEAASSSGDIKLLDIEGGIDASSSSGDIEATIKPVGQKEFDFSTASGDVELTYLTPKGYGFVLEIGTGSGSISADITIKVEKITRRTLKGIVGSGSAKIKITTASGDVTLNQR